ncbi:helix-turn-helix domain-containing protein [Paenibacillus cymbidii]|uniref:helix-turn-helix domain-containing protein n=1 Tax=Paenibacillus cymbidii TaxID=1639034 RepID=UPI0010805AF1|nr:helix-turn-helix transcriptional regulator [Paenibacillus cymbidii]
MSQLAEQVGNRIRMYRKSSNLTQIELGDLLNIDASYLGKIERGEANATLEMINNIAIALKISPFELFVSPSNKNSSIENISTTLLGFNNNDLKIVSRIIKDIYSLTEGK